MQLVYIGAFGLAGVFLRYFVSLAVNGTTLAAPGQTFPWATFLVNLVGAFAVGAVYTLGMEKFALSPELRAGIIVGLLGGFTTFSAFCLENMQLLNEGRLLQAGLYIALSNALGLTAAFAGMALVRNL